MSEGVQETGCLSACESVAVCVYCARGGRVCVGLGVCTCELSAVTVPPRDEWHKQSE